MQRAAAAARCCSSLLGLFGASLFFGETVLTPAISVVSAVEGLEVGTPLFKPWVLPIAVRVLVGLFALQRLGTAKVGALFGPVCLLWFLALGAVGRLEHRADPGGARGGRPAARATLPHQPRLASFVVLGAVLLAFTGAEALYADMGHFGKWPIRIAWFALVLPALVLNYFGQGALLIANPTALENPFYLAFPGWALYPMVALATAATVIASQASITGAVLAHAAGDAARLPAAHQHRADLGARVSARSTSRRSTGSCCVDGARRGARLRLLAAASPRPTAWR